MAADRLTPDPSRAEQDRHPVIAVNNRGLTLGLDSTRSWILWNRANTVWPAQGHFFLWLLPLLERPLDAVAGVIAAAEADESLLPGLVRFALTSGSTYWVGLALGWLEAGYPSADLVPALAALKDGRRHTQPVRHRALRLWKKATETREPPPGRPSGRSRH